eukprot:2200_1
MHTVFLIHPNPFYTSRDASEYTSFLTCIIFCFLLSHFNALLCAISCISSVFACKQSLALIVSCNSNCTSTACDLNFFSFIDLLFMHHKCILFYASCYSTDN